MRVPFFLRIVFPVLIAAFPFATAASQPSTPLRLTGGAEVAPDGRSVAVRARLECREMLRSVRLEVAAPGEDALLEAWPSSLAAEGAVRLDAVSGLVTHAFRVDMAEVDEVAFRIAPGKPGDHRVDVRVLSPRENGDIWGDQYSFFYHDDGVIITEGYQELDEGVASAGFRAVPGEIAEAPLPCTQPAPTALPDDAAPSALQPTGTLTVHGRWMVFDQTDDYIPQREQLCELLNGSGDHLAWAYTDLDGYYTFPGVSNPGSLYVTVRAEVTYNRSGGSDHLWVSNSSGGNYYTYTATQGGVPDGDYDMGTWHVNNGDTYEKAYWAIRSLQDVWRYLYFAIGGGTHYAGAIRCQWYPGSTDGTYYSILDNRIHLADDDPRSKDTVVHESGHNIMYNCYGLLNYPWNDCPSPHYIELDGGDHCGWTEGWGDFLSLAVNGDPVYTWPSGGALNLENPTWGTGGWDNGPRVEGRVAGALWDVIDANNEANNDFHTDPVDTLWDTFFHTSDSHFCDYWDATRSYGLKRSRDNELYQNTIDSCNTCAEDPYEDDDSCAQATVEGAPSTYTYEHCTDQDYQYVDVGLDWAYTWSTNDLGYLGDTTLTLYASDCATQLAYDDDGGTWPRSSRMAWTSDRSARVYVAARQWGSYGAHRSYDISLSRSCPSPTAAKLLTPANSATLCASPTLTWTGYGRTYTVTLDGAPLCTGVTGGSCATSGLAVGWHSWSVATANACAGTSASPTWWFFVETAPGSPGDSLRGAKSGGNVVLTWGACARATIYNVKRCDASGGPCTPTANVATPSVTTHSEPLDATPYFYLIEASNVCGTAP